MEMVLETEPRIGKDTKDEVRRRTILDAAFWCFMKFGYETTSLEDVAKRESLSRPLLDQKFQGKREIFVAVLEDLAEMRYPADEKALQAPGGARTRLMLLEEALVLEPWSRFQEEPMAKEFADASARIAPEVKAKQKKRQLKYTHEVLGSKDLAEVFRFAVEGLFSDLPKTRVLRRRLELLIEKFTS